MVFKNRKKNFEKHRNVEKPFEKLFESSTSFDFFEFFSFEMKMVGFVEEEKKPK